MFPTFISILDIQSWWEVPSIAHFCSLFRTAFNLLDFDIEDLEEALLTDGTEESSWLQELIVRLLSGCLPSNEISTFNYQMFLRRIFRQKCQEHDRYNPFNTDIDFQLLPLRTKVDILHALCDFRLDADDVLDQLKNLEADSLRVEPLGYDSNESAYWYFYGTRLYREDFNTKNNKKKSVWQVICFTEDDWFQLTRKFKKSTSKVESQLYQTLSENFLPELPRLFKEKESLARKRLLENQPRRTSSRLRKLENESEKELVEEASWLREKAEKENKLHEQENQKLKRQEAYDKRNRLKELSEEDTLSEGSVHRDEMAGTRNKASKGRQRKIFNSSTDSKDNVAKSSKCVKRIEKTIELSQKSGTPFKLTTVGRQTNNSLSAATGQILIQPLTNPHKKKLKTSQIFRQTDEDLQTGMHKILDFVKNHEDAWPFAEPVEEEYAPNYYTVIRKPMDLQKMEERLESGSYKTFSKFRADFQLIVDNCRLYNGTENEYTEMVDNLLNVFERATEKYLDQISSSDDEIAVEYLNVENEHNDVRSKTEEASASKRKPMLAAQTDKKRERSFSEDSSSSTRNDPFDLEVKIVPKTKESDVNKKQVKNKSKKEKFESKKDAKKEKIGSKKEKLEIKCIKKDKEEGKKMKESKKSKEKKNKSKKTSRKDKKKTVIKCRSPSRSPSRSIRSNLSSPPPSWPPSSPDNRFDFLPRQDSKKRLSQEINDSDDSSSKGKHKKSSKYNDFDQDIKDDFHFEKKIESEYSLPPISPKPKDKHNKLRETIEKLKAKSELQLEDELNFELDHPKENKEKIKKVEKEEIKAKSKIKDKSSLKSKKDIVELDFDTCTMDSIQSEEKKEKNASLQKQMCPLTKSTSNLEALSIATEQTLKDINKWLDDTPKFAEFSSASNSPSYTGLDEFDILTGVKIEQIPGKKVDKPIGLKKEASKDIKKKPFRDPAKFFKRREVQRTIDRLQPGKSKGNLISNVQNTNKTEEIFPLGPLSKNKDTKNSLIVKTDTNAPKLSLGSVLDSFGKHKFVDDQKKGEQAQIQVLKEENQQLLMKEPDNVEIKQSEDLKDLKDVTQEKNVIESSPLEDTANTGATPNLSAWFKAFGAPKMPATQRKDIKPDGKENEKTEEKLPESRKVTIPLVSPNIESPHGQPVPRQRKISTGSSMSERSSFSQDMDSPRVGMDERGAYPAPYPSPLHRSPSGASPVIASPRPDISPKGAAYPTINGQIRVGFYQDTVSNKSSPDKSCSPRENPQSPYPHYSEHVYTPNTTTESNYYSYANSPYYSHAPNYSNTNPTMPYNTEGANMSYYDTSKSLTDQYQVKSVVSNQLSPAHLQHLQNSPNVNNPHSPAVHSPHSPTIYSQHSPTIHPQNSPSLNPQHSPSIPSPNIPNPPSVQSQHSQHSPIVHPQHSPSIHSPTTKPDSPEVEMLPQDEPKLIQPQVTQANLFPVKKRVYSDDLPEISIQKYEIDSRLQQRQRTIPTNGVIELDLIPETPLSSTEKKVVTKQAEILAASQDIKQQSLQNDLSALRPDFNATNISNPYNNTFTSESNYTLNIPTARSVTSSQQNKIDMSKYTNMGYTGPDVNFTRSLQHFTKPELSSSRTTISSSIPQKQPTLTTSSDSNTMRFCDPKSVLQQAIYKNLELPNTQQAHANFNTNTRSLENISNRMQESSSEYKADVTIPRPTYNAPTIDVDQPLGLGRNMSNLSHIVDRFSSEERMLAGIQNSSSYYTEKSLGSSHLFNKSISSSASGLPMFSQANIAAMQSYNESVQASSSSMFSRQMTELQNPGIVPSDTKTTVHIQGQDKKAKKRRNKSVAAVGTSEPSQLSTVANQGFQSYAGLKSNTTIEPNAISLKTSSVMPGSAFNFGPTPAGLGMSGLYGDKDGYPNFLDEFRSAPNYYMAAAAAHHRTTPDTTEKQSGRTGHQTSNPQATTAYPFLGAPQGRHTYPIGGPFIPNAQPQLMDTSSPLYQQYIQAGLLNQSLLGPHGAYPPGYHAALSMRQPYDSMSRPSWL